VRKGLLKACLVAKEIALVRGYGLLIVDDFLTYFASLSQTLRPLLRLINY
jgi:hypothetical protein